MNLEAINAKISYRADTVLTIREIAELDSYAIRSKVEKPGVVQLQVMKYRWWPFKNSPFWMQIKAEYPSAEHDSDAYPIITITDPYDCIKFKFEYTA